MNPEDALSLLDWKRQIFALYERVRNTRDSREAWTDWCTTRDQLFKNHPQSPIPVVSRDSYQGIPVFDYREDLRLTGKLRRAEPAEIEIPDSDGGAIHFTRFAQVHLEIGSVEMSLDIFWLLGYGGGIFLPFRDTTAGTSTYGAGRYLYDTVKGADLGGSGNTLVLDFNFAYNPSCSYDTRWVCPLAPTGNRLDTAIEAGERIQ